MTPQSRPSARQPVGSRLGLWPVKRGLPPNRAPSVTPRLAMALNEPVPAPRSPGPC